MSLCVGALLLLGAGCAPSLHDVIGLGDMDRVESMLAAHPELAHSTNELGKQPLHYAVYYNRQEAMGLLLDAGADVNAADNTGLTPLHVAAMMGRKSTLWLLDHGADMKKRDVFGDLPSHAAAFGGKFDAQSGKSSAMRGQLRVLTALFKKGDPLTEKNNAGQTPLDLARAHRKLDAAKHIEGLLGIP